MKLIGLGILAFLGFKALNISKTAITADNLNFKPSGFKFMGFKQGAFNLDLFFDIVNPTQNNLTINFLFCDLFFKDGNLLTSVNLPNYNQTVSKAQVSTLKVPVKIFLTDILFNLSPIFSDIKKGKMPTELQAKGYIRVNKITVQFDEPIKLL